MRIRSERRHRPRRAHRHGRTVRRADPRAAPMIRVDDVRFAAELATQLTGGVFELADARLGKEGRAHTWIYVDRRRPLVWRGRHGSIRAAGYYLGVAQA